MVEQESEQIRQTLNGASRIPGIMAYPTALLGHEQWAQMKNVLPYLSHYCNRL